MASTFETIQVAEMKFYPEYQELVIRTLQEKYAKYGTREIMNYSLETPDGKHDFISATLLNYWSKQGLVTRKVGGRGTYGHVDYVMTDALLAIEIEPVTEPAAAVENEQPATPTMQAPTSIDDLCLGFDGWEYGTTGRAWYLSDGEGNKVRDWSEYHTKNGYAPVVQFRSREAAAKYAEKIWRKLQKQGKSITTLTHAPTDTDTDTDTDTTTAATAAPASGREDSDDGNITALIQNNAEHIQALAHERGCWHEIREYDTERGTLVIQVGVDKEWKQGYADIMLTELANLYEDERYTIMALNRGLYGTLHVKYWTLKASKEDWRTDMIPFTPEQSANTAAYAAAKSRAVPVSVQVAPRAATDEQIKAWMLEQYNAHNGDLFVGHLAVLGEQQFNDGKQDRRFLDLAYSVLIPLGKEQPQNGYQQLQAAERAEEEAQAALMDATEPGVQTLDYNAARDVWNAAYLRTRELGAVIGYRAGVENGNSDYEAQRISATYSLSLSPRMQPELYVRLYNYLVGYCGRKGIPEGWEQEGTYATFAAANIYQFDMSYKQFEIPMLLAAIESIVIDLDVWGIPKQQ